MRKDVPAKVNLTWSTHVTETWEPAPNTGHTEPVRAGQCKTSRVSGVGGIEFELDNTADDGNGNGIRAGINDCACKRDHGKQRAKSAAALEHGLHSPSEFTLPASDATSARIDTCNASAG